MVEAPDPHGMVPTTTMTIQMVFEIIHVLWRDSLIHCDIIITTNNVSQDLGIIGCKSWIILLN